MAKKLAEQGALVESKGVNGVFPIRIITEGKGSSGTYTRELLESYGSVFENRAMHMNHPADPNAPWERDVLKIAARTGKVEMREVDGIAGLYTEAKVRSEYREFIEEFGDLIGVSIYISGDGREEGNEYIVESFDGSDPYASVDFVVAAGRGGRVEKMIESYRAIETSAGIPAGNGSAQATADNVMKEDDTMDVESKALIESLVESVNALTAKVDSIVTLSESAIAASADKVDAFEVADELSKAIAEAKLPEVGRKRVLESVKAGTSIESAVKSEVEYVKVIAESLGSVDASSGQAGRVMESDNDFEFKGFGSTK